MGGDPIFIVYQVTPTNQCVHFVSPIAILRLKYKDIL